MGINENISSIDYDAINKGYIITDAELEKILECSSDTKVFSHRKMQLQGRIESELRSRGKDWVVSGAKERIEVLVDDCASDHCDKQTVKAVRSIEKHHRKRGAIDTGKLSTERRRTHDRKLKIGS